MWAQQLGPEQSLMRRATGIFLLLSGCNSPHGAPTADPACYMLYSHNPAEQGPLCPEKCPVHTHCKDDKSRTSCTAVDDCSYLRPRGEQVTLSWTQASGSSAVSYQACVPCDIKGCLKCEGSDNGKIVCKECALHWKSDGKGKCTFTADFFDHAVYIFLGVVSLLLIWVVISLLRSEFAETANWDSLKRGLVMRRRAQLFMSRSSGGHSADSEQLQRYPLCTNLHTVESGRIMGPGLTLFMNWFIFMGCLSFWLCLGAFIYGLREADLDPCLQQDRIGAFIQRFNAWSGNDGVTYWKLMEGWDFGDNPMVGDRDNRFLKWATWNYIGAFLMTFLFLYCQQRLWNLMVQDSKHPSLREYAVMISGVPPAEKDKEKLCESLGHWMTKLGLDCHGIRSISIAYEIPSGKSKLVEELTNNLLNSVAVSRTVSDLPDGPSGDIHSTSSKWFLWVQMLAFFLFQTPFRQGAGRARISPELLESGEVEVMLHGLRGSGCIFVVMNTEALARAVAGMGVVHLEGICPNPLRVCKARAEPQMICWMNYHHKINIAWRFFSVVQIIVGLIFALFIWLLLFACFLSFELSTNGYGGVSKGMAGFFFGMLVPIGNALMGLVVDLLLKNYGFRDEDDLQLWRQILNVFVNFAANMGEIYLVFKKTLLNAEWLPDEFFINFTKVFQPVGFHPSAHEFQKELKAILFPMGMLVPIFTIPLLSDVVPWLIGRLRVKSDPCVRAAEAERILRPAEVDFLGPYTDFLINFSFLTFASWISPGKYLVTLWITMCIWLLLLYVNMRFNVLRWQAVTYIGGKKTHHCEALLLSVPLGWLAGALNHGLFPKEHHGLLGFCLHVSFHVVFVQYVLHTLEPPRQSFGTTLDEMMNNEYAPVADYINTNPIEVLRSHYIPEHAKDHLGRVPVPEHAQDHLARDPGRHAKAPTFYRNDKWYLQPRWDQQSSGPSRCHFAGEERVGRWSLRRPSEDKVPQTPGDATNGGKSELPSGASTNPFSPPSSPKKFDAVAGEAAVTSHLQHLSERVSNKRSANG